MYVLFVFFVIIKRRDPPLVFSILGEAIRATLGIEQWGLVLGGSWGSTLALA